MQRVYLIVIVCFFTQLAFSQVIWSDDFENGLASWTTIDADGDGQNWAIGSSPAINVASGTSCAISYSWTQATGAITPNNYLISPAIDLADVAGTVLVDWKAYAQDQTWNNEHYQVIAATGNTQADIDEGTLVYDGTVGTNGGAYSTLTGSISDFAGGTVYVAFVHNMVTDQFALNIDDVEVYSSSVIDVGVTAVSSPNHDSGCTLSSAENITAVITNFGGAEATGIEVSYSINGGATVTETVTAAVAPAATFEHTFAAPVDMSALGEYSIEVSATITDDDDATNDATTLATRSSDAVITVHAMSDVSGGHAWTITDNSTGQVVASRGAYQWNLEVFDDVCVYSDKCYTFNYEGEMGAGAFLEVLLDGVSVAGDTGGAGVAATLEYPAIGGGCAADGARFEKTTFSTYNLINTTTPISAEIKNIGTAAITEFVANYTVNGGTPISQTFTGVNIPPGGVYDLSFSAEFDVNQLVVSDVVITVGTVNGVANDAATNNGAGKVIPVSEVVARSFVVEEGTGTWCQFCPRGDVGLESITTTHDDAIGIAVHNDDPMDFGDYDLNLIIEVEGTGYPFSGINRTFDTDPNAAGLEVAYQAEKTKIVPASLTATATIDANDDLTVDVSAEIFAVLMPENYRINVVLTEDGVTGTGSGYAQINAFSGGTTVMGGYELLPNPVPASDMVYDHVARELMGGFQGDEGSFPSDATNADAPTYQYTGEINAAWDVTKMHAVALLINTDNGEIVNSVSTTIELETGIADLYQNELAKVYPNPFSDITNVELTLNEAADVTMEVISAVGQRVAYRDYGQLSGDMVLPFNGSNLENGMYFIHIRMGEKLITKKVLLAR